MSKTRDKAVCVVSGEEVETWNQTGVPPNCSEHKHISERDARMFVYQTRQMSEHYSQIREQRKREALEAAFERGHASNLRARTLFTLNHGARSGLTPSRTPAASRDSVHTIGTGREVLR